LFFLVALVVCTAGAELNVVLAALVIKQTNKEASGKAENSNKSRKHTAENKNINKKNRETEKERSNKNTETKIE
jgi:uncharacterized protein YlxW (UPF0749 family)